MSFERVTVLVTGTVLAVDVGRAAAL